MQRVDLVLGGGGVRGAAHVGVLDAVGAAGLTVHRAAGASAGALAAALAVGGMGSDRMAEALVDLDARGFALSDVVGRLARRPLVGGVLERLGQPATIDPLSWVEGLLAECGVETWSDLALDDPALSLPPERRYRVVVRCLDLVHRRVVRLPWDYARYGLDPDTQSVARAVRASMSVPLVFDPVPMGEGDRAGLLVDGGIGSGFPVSVLDRPDGAAARWPTVAVRLLSRQRRTGWPDGELDLLRAVVEAMLAAGNAMEPSGECDERRTVRVDTSDVASLDVRDVAVVAEELREEGRRAMSAHLGAHDLDGWNGGCRG